MRRSRDERQVDDKFGQVEGNCTPTQRAWEKEEEREGGWQHRPLSSLLALPLRSNPSRFPTTSASRAKPPEQVTAAEEKKERLIRSGGGRNGTQYLDTLGKRCPDPGKRGEDGRAGTLFHPPPLTSSGTVSQGQYKFTLARDCGAQRTILNWPRGSPPGQGPLGNIRRREKRWLACRRMKCFDR